MIEICYPDGEAQVLFLFLLSPPFSGHSPDGNPHESYLPVDTDLLLE